MKLNEKSRPITSKNFVYMRNGLKRLIEQKNTNTLRANQPKSLRENRYLTGSEPPLI